MPTRYFEPADPLADEYVSPLEPMPEGEELDLPHALDEVRRCMHNIDRFKRWLDTV